MDKKNTSWCCCFASRCREKIHRQLQKTDQKKRAELNLAEHARQLRRITVGLCSYHTETLQSLSAISLWLFWFALRLRFLCTHLPKFNAAKGGKLINWRRNKADMRGPLAKVAITENCVCGYLHIIDNVWNDYTKNLTSNYLYNPVYKVKVLKKRTDCHSLHQWSITGYACRVRNTFQLLSRAVTQGHVGTVALGPPEKSWQLHCHCFERGCTVIPMQRNLSNDFPICFSECAVGFYKSETCFCHRDHSLRNLGFFLGGGGTLNVTWQHDTTWQMFFCFLKIGQNT